MFASRNRFFANGYTANTTTNRLTPLYVKIAPISTIASIALFAPTSLTIVFAIDAASPDISTTFPKIAPSKNTGKYSLIKPAIFSIKIDEKKGSTWLGSVSSTANNAQIGANKMTENPRYAVNISKPNANRMMISSTHIPHFHGSESVYKDSPHRPFPSPFHMYGKRGPTIPIKKGKLLFSELSSAIHFIPIKISTSTVISADVISFSSRTLSSGADQASGVI